MENPSDEIQPLSGVKVLDLTQALAGPFGSQLMSDMGADVIKLEPPRGDLTRTSPPHYVEGQSIYFLSLNRNKRSVVIDLKSEEGMRVFHDLVRWSDVVYSNFGPGVVQRLGITYSNLRRINPKVITCEISGFGFEGPEADKRAVDVVIQAVAGGMSITGLPEMPPVRAGVPTADISAGMLSVIGILAALLRRAQTGQGMEVHASLFQSQLSLLAYVAAYALFSNEAPQPVGSGHLGTVPSQAFETADGHIVIDAGFNHHFNSLCDVLGLDIASDPRFKDRPARSRSREILVPILTERLRSRPTGHWKPLLDEAGIPNGPVNDVLEALASEQSVAMAAVGEVEYRGTPVEVLKSPINFNRSKQHKLQDPPSLGQHTRPVLRDVLGYDEVEIKRLFGAGVVSGDE